MNTSWPDLQTPIPDEWLRGPFGADDILLEAVDDHCSPMLAVMAKKQPVIDWAMEFREHWGEAGSMWGAWTVKNAVSWALWYGRSSVSEKVDVVTGEKHGFLHGKECPNALRLMDEFYDQFDSMVEGVSRWWIRQVLGG